MILRRPQLADKANILAMMTEFDQSDSPHDGGFWEQDNFVYEDWLESNLKAELGLDLADGWVPAIQLVGFDNDKPVGFLNLRLRLNDYLINQGGHIGYSVRPSQRGKGYAKAMLKEALTIAASKNIQQILVTCHQENLASKAVIKANGGVLEDMRDGVERYWIEGDCYK